MLGIRRYQGVAIDLFQGDIALFAVDVVVSATLAGLLAGESQRARHVAIDTTQPGGSQPAQVLSIVKAFLDGERELPAVRRITLVTSTSEDYANLQGELFRTFADEEA